MNNKERFKNFRCPNFDIVELRKRRSDDGSDMRQDKREMQKMLQRNIEEDNLDELVDQVELMEVDRDSSVKPLALRNQWMNLLTSGSSYDQQRAVDKIKAQISINSKSTVDEIIALKLLQRLFELIQYHQSPQLQLKVAFILTAVTVQSTPLPSCAIPGIAQVLQKCCNDEALSSVMNVIGNIALEGRELRDRFHEVGLSTMLMKILENTTHINLLINGVWALSTLFADVVEEQNVSRCVNVLKKLLNHAVLSVCAQACWAMSRFCIRSATQTRAIIDADLCPRLVQLLACGTSDAVVGNALRVISIIVAGDEKQTQAVIDSCALPVLRHLLRAGTPYLVCKTCSVISNITAGTRPQIQAVINADIFPVLIGTLKCDDEHLKLEATWAIRKAISEKRSSVTQIDYLVSLGCITALGSLLMSMNVEIVRLAMKALKTILKFGCDEYFMQLLSCGVYDAIKSNSSHEHPDVQKYSHQIDSKVTDWKTSSGNLIR